MGSNGGSNITPLRKTLPLRVLKPDVNNIKNLARKLKKVQRVIFMGKFGKILDLLEVNVQVDALTALAQFYDPPFRCFTFKDFQLAPTLEEFERIMGYPMKGSKPYQYMEHYPSLKTIAETFDIPIKEIEDNRTNKDNLIGFPIKYLEEKAVNLARDGKWDTFMDVLALIIYGIVLFPTIKDFVDFMAIYVFLAYKHRGENPVPAVLADIYCTLDFRHEKEGGLIHCCSPILYFWFVKHIFQDMHQLKTKSKKEWANVLANLNERTIQWYSRSQDINEVICRCGVFVDVPLMGTKGCINYSPYVALRQLGYPMTKPPIMDVTKSFVIHGRDGYDASLLRRIRKSWEDVVRRGQELGPRSCGIGEEYHNWVKRRALEVKLPFHSTIITPEVVTTESFFSTEDLEADLALKGQEIEKLQKELEMAHQAYRDMEYKNTQQSLILEKVQKRAREEEESKERTRICLRGANEELRLRRQERDDAVIEGLRLKELLKKSGEKHEIIRRQEANLKQQIERVRAECENKIMVERQCQEEIIEAYRVELARKEDEMYTQKDTIERLVQEGMFWMDRFSKLVYLTNSAIGEIPPLLRAADGMANPLSTPQEISIFIEHCKSLIEQMKKLMAH